MAHQELHSVEPPALPLALRDYDQGAQEQYNNILRIFFNRLTTLLRIIMSSDDGARVLYFPYGQFYDTTTQTASGTGSEQLVTWNTVRHASNSVSVASSSRITVTKHGIYEVCFIGQVATTSSTTDTIEIWLKKSGTNVAYTTRKFLVPGDMAVALNTIVEIDINEYVEIAWAVSSTDIRFSAATAASPNSGTPSVMGNITFVSNVRD